MTPKVQGLSLEFQYFNVMFSEVRKSEVLDNVDEESEYETVTESEEEQPIEATVKVDPPSGKSQTTDKTLPPETLGPESAEKPPDKTEKRVQIDEENNDQKVYRYSSLLLHFTSMVTLQ